MVLLLDGSLAYMHNKSILGLVTVGVNNMYRWCQVVIYFEGW